MHSVTMSERFPGLFVAIIAFLVYANSLGNGFVGDDHSVVLNNPVLQGTPLSLFSAIDTTSDAQLLPYYRPLTYLTFLIEERLHGFNPFLMHLFNVLLHSANAFLIYCLAHSLFRERYAPFFVALLFAVHPLHAEGVNFISGGRNTMLACFFSLIAYLLHHSSIGRGKFSFALGGAVFFLAGLFSKESALAVLPFILLQEIAPLRESVSGSRLRTAIRLFPYFAAVICYVVMRWMTLSALGIQTSIIPGLGTEKLQSMYIIPSLTERLLNNIFIIPKYLLTIIWPISLSSRYVVPENLHLLALPLLAAWLCIFTMLGWLFTRGRSPVTLFGLFWLTAFWLPVSGIVYFSSVPVADRFLYIPAIGLWIVVADQASRLLSSRNMPGKYVIAAVIFIILFFSALTLRRNLDWHSDMTLFTRLVEQYPENAYGHFNLGSAYIQRRSPNDLKLAEEEFEKALALDPAMQEVHTPLGYTRLEQGNFEGALSAYSRALEIYPLDKDARINRGIAFEKLGRYNEALADYQFFLTIPGYNNIPGSREHAERKVLELSRPQK